MFGLGFGELVVILLIVLVMFGGRKLPEIGEGIGRAIRSFKKEINKPDAIDVTPETSAKPDRDKGSHQA
jgi:sec-independent protein translocase protein TatA